MLKSIHGWLRLTQLALSHAVATLGFLILSNTLKCATIVCNVAHFKIDPLKVKARILAKLVECFGEKASSPIDWVAHDWNRVPNMCGAYTNNFPPGCLSLFGDALRTPVGRVHFAGEFQ